MKCMKPMMDWVDAKVDMAITHHNAEFHKEQVSDAERIAQRMREKEKEARDKLLRMM